MGVRIFRTTNDYIKHITSIERAETRTLVASSFLSSHLFSKNILLRFFERDLKSAQAAKLAADDLWKRTKWIHANMKKQQYKEIYEMDAFKQFCDSGTVHRQTPAFKATPNEIQGVLLTMANLIDKTPNYEVAFCREVLPFVFIVKGRGGLTIDVRNNFGYQRIQGLLIDDEPIVTEFENEFCRIWNEETTVSDRPAVISLIRANIEAASQGSRYFTD